MIKINSAFSGFSVDDLNAAKQFYQERLGLKVTQTPEGLEVKASKDLTVFLYPKPNHTPATFTVLNFVVDEIESAVSELKKKDVKLEHYSDPHTGKDGIFRGDRGPKAIAWFKDPAGNILSVIEER